MAASKATACGLMCGVWWAKKREVARGYTWPEEMAEVLAKPIKTGLN